VSATIPTREEHRAPSVLVASASRHGATGEIAERIGEALARRGLDATVIPVEQVKDVRDYDAIVLGSAVYSGHWLDPATELIRKSSDGFADRPVWLFSSGPVGDPARKLVQQMSVDPVELPELLEQTKAQGHRLFAGKLEKRSLSRVQRGLLSLVRDLDGDFRNWTEIERWASEIAVALIGGQTAVMPAAS
jgi:menaquinone-dependent protoporphyrinogen oxidase